MFNKVKVRDLIHTPNSLTGFYNGIVVDRNDPKGLQRVRVEIFNLTKGIPVDHLPWYSVASPVSSHPNSSGVIPPLRSEVVVEFDSDDIYNGVVKYMLESRPPAQG